MNALLNNLRHWLALLVFFQTTLAFGQTIHRDTSYHNKGIVACIADFDTIKYVRCGYYAEFDLQGNKILEGQYKAVDSLPCKECYEWSSNGNIIAYDYTDAREQKTGEWKSFYPNGILKERGFYSATVHEFYGTQSPRQPQNHPENVYSEIEYLKTGTWEYFNESGQLEKTIEYLDGQIIFITEYY